MSAEEKLAIILRYLAMRETFSSLMYQYHMHKPKIFQFAPDVCEAIYSVLAPDYMRLPSLREKWEHINEQTNEKWPFPNCFAVVDGKYVEIICPKHSGSKFCNCKGFYSILLFASFVDYDYTFLIAEVGCQVQISYEGVYRNPNFDSA